MTLYIIFFVIILAVVIFGFVAESRIHSTFTKYKSVISINGKTASESARMLLDKSGATDIKILPCKGKLTDHYDPKTKTVYLSEEVINSSSISALGISAHEVGHAIQHHEKYKPLMIRQSICPYVNFGSWIFLPLFILGVILASLSMSAGAWCLWIAVALYSLTTIFYLITYPVELDASKRALILLEETGVLTNEETSSARIVLKSASNTYLAGLLMSIVQLVRFALMAFSVFSEHN
ncbi:MAG: zinc metallopeptidase [Clostridia bacterium]